MLSGLRAPFVLTLWFYSFSINTYGWRRAGVNNVLIFEFDPRSYLDFVQLAEVRGHPLIFSLRSSFTSSGVLTAGSVQLCGSAPVH